jgi:predicted dehydrogenase
MNRQPLSRRNFMRLTAGTAALGAAGNISFLTPEFLAAAPRRAAASDRVRFASIGTGVRGCDIMRAALACPNVEVVAVSDLYDGRLIAGQEAAGKPLPTTKDYRAILDRKDVDAVLAAVPDHWHRRIVEDACAAGKDVYCEKPMSHTVEDGFAMVDAMKKYQRIVQVGSQARSSIVYAKAREIYSSGSLGQVALIEAWIDRNDASGAWVYPIPPDADEKTVDWERFLGSAPRRPFDLKRFFRWRCFKDYGEGLPGDLFVHLLTGMFTVTGINQPPIRACSMGGQFRWKNDDRDVADLVWTLYEYPDFRVSIRCNQNNESPGVTRVFGTKGTLEIKNDILTVTPQTTQPAPEGYSILGWPEKLRKEYLADWRKEHPAPTPGTFPLTMEAQVFKAPDNYDYTQDHFLNFFESVRSRKPSVEDALFGNHTAIACHMANYSLERKTMAVWDERSKTIKG